MTSKIDFKALFSESEISDPVERGFANTKVWAILQCELQVFGSAAQHSYHGIPTEWHILCKPEDTHKAVLLKVEKLDSDK